MTNRYLYITLLTILGFHAEAQAQMATQAPRLVVNIAVDNLRTDYLENFASLYTDKGLRRLLNEGLVYSNGSYNFSPVDCSSAIASLLTGTPPYYNGITGSEWLDRKTLRPHISTHDEQHEHSPRHLATSTVGDEIKMATNGVAKVFSFAATADAAIFSAGHAADGAAWISQGQWQTSAYYTPRNQWLSGYARLYSPASDTNKALTDAAIRCIQQAGIGLDDKPDLICLSYPAPQAMEGYVALDRTIGELIAGIEAKLSIDKVLLVLTSTGTNEENEYDNDTYRIPTGHFSMTRTASLLNIYLGAIYGINHYVEARYRNQIYLNHKLFEQKNIDLGDVLRRSQEFLLQLSGVRNVYTSSQLMTSDSYRLERVRNGFNVEKCGDLIIDIVPGWKLINEDTNQTQISRLSNVPFPIIFFGAGIRAEHVKTPVTTDHIAPTIARTIRIRAPNACSAEPLF